MSSSLSDLRSFRMNKTTNGAAPSKKLATGRKRIRVISDSSDEENVETKPTPSTPDKTTTNGLSVKEKEERYNLLRQIVDTSVCSLLLQDFLVRNNWDVQKAFDAYNVSPIQIAKSSVSVQSPAVSPVKHNYSLNSSSDAIKVQKPKHKVRHSKSQSIQLF